MDWTKLVLGMGALGWVLNGVACKRWWSRSVCVAMALSCVWWFFE